MQNVFSIDVEDWFNILDLELDFPLSEWGQLESRVERNTYWLLEALAKRQVTCTCFILGWFAEQFPQLIKDIADAGHEIASHGYAHGLVYELSEEEFVRDLTRSIDTIKDATGIHPAGYRAPGFSITEKCRWAFDHLIESSFQFDSSIFPAQRNHGGIVGEVKNIHVIMEKANKSLIEIPISTTRILGKDICFCGGGYLRALPTSIIKSKIQAHNADGLPAVLYIHPRDIDPEQPRMQMNAKRRFMSYYNLHTTKEKIERLLDEFNFTSIGNVIQNSFR